MNPLCPACHSLLLERADPDNHLVDHVCTLCGSTYTQHSEGWLPADADVTKFFDEVARALREMAGLSNAEASTVARDYYVKFRDAAYCESLGIPTQDDEFFFHESARGVARRAWYYLVLQRDPDPGEFIKWRSSSPLSTEA